MALAGRVGMASAAASHASSPRPDRANHKREALVLPPQLLVADGNSETLRQVSALLRDQGYAVSTEDCAAAALERLSEARGTAAMPDLAILGLGANERGVLDRLATLDMSIGLPPVIVIVGAQDTELREAALASGADVIIESPVVLEVLPSAVAEAFPLEWALGC